MTGHAIHELIRERADYTAQLNLLPYTGTPEIKEVKEGSYLYVRNRVGSRTESTYVGVYSDELYQALLRYARDAKELRKQIRRVNRQLAELGYQEGDLDPRTVLNLDFARANMKESIYEQAVLEGVSTTFPQTEAIIDGGVVNGMTATDIQKVLNLKHAWEFILDPDVILAPSDLSLLCFIGRLVNEGFYTEGGRLRSVPVAIGGSSYVPPIPFEPVVRERIDALLEKGKTIEPIETAVSLALFVMKTQVFLDGNKRSAIIFANHYLIAHGAGFLVVPEAKVSEFKRLLVEYYESDTDESSEGDSPMRLFLKESCWRRMPAAALG